MTPLHHALRADRTPPPPGQRAAAKAPTVLVAGGGGELGSAVLECLLGSRHVGTVKVLATRGFTPGVGRIEALLEGALAAAPNAAEPPLGAATAVAQTAVVVFDRERQANGRERAFARPLPHDLPALARALHTHGVAHLIVVLPHAPASLPEALKAGLASLDEQAVAALGFEHVVFVRSAQAAAGERADRWLQRVADAALAQMKLMIAPSNQPVRPLKVAHLVAALVARLPASAPGTRVVPPELVWHAAQRRHPGAALDAFFGLPDGVPVVAEARDSDDADHAGYAGDAANAAEAPNAANAVEAPRAPTATTRRNAR